MVYEVDQPNYLEGISDSCFALKFVFSSGPLIVAVEKSAIVFDPPGSAPENEIEWAVVAESIGAQLQPHILRLADEHDVIRTSGNVTWHHLDITAVLLKQHGITLNTQAHWMRRNQHFSA